MLNILPHIYQRIGKWMIILMMIVPMIGGIISCLVRPINWSGNEDSDNNISLFIDRVFDTHSWLPEYIGNLLIAIGIILYFMSKDKIQDEYVDMLKLKSISIVFIASAVIGFLFHNVSTPLVIISLIQVFAYIVTLKYFKKFTV